MSFKKVVEQYSGRLTATDELLIKELLAHPVEASFFSTTELAGRLNVHEATAVRLAQKLGYRGYPELRADLQADLIDDTSPAERIRRRMAHTAEASILETLVADEIAALQELTQVTSQAQLDLAAQKLCAARRIFLFGRGHATILVELMDRRLRRSGFDTIDLRWRGRDLAERLLTLGADDLVLAFAFRTRPRELRPLLLQAETVGAPTLLISDTLGSLIRPQPSLVLAARRGVEGEYQTLMVPMAICNALVLTITRFDAGRAMASLDRLAHLVNFIKDNEEEK